MAATKPKPEVLDPEYIGDEDVKALTVMPPPASLVVSRPPAMVLAEAKEAATALVELIKSKPDLTVKLNGNDYLKFEAWQTIGKFYGASPKVVDTKYIEYGEVKGFEAKVVVINANGMEVSGAEAMCMNDERNWKGKPMFQLRSMAQTRASSKALRNVFAWVVVLAGYKATPAEEMDNSAALGFQGGRMDQDELRDRLEHFFKCETMEELEAHYRASYMEAKKCRDQEALDLVIAAKNKRKGELMGAR